MNWVPEKMHEGKCSTDLSQLDQGVEPLSPYGDTSFLGGLIVNWIMSMLGLRRNNVTKRHWGKESMETPILSIYRQVGYLVVEHANRN